MYICVCVRVYNNNYQIKVKKMKQMKNYQKSGDMEVQQTSDLRLREYLKTSKQNRRAALRVC